MNILGKYLPPKRRHIKLKATLNESKALVTVTILEQTHRGFDFGLDCGVHKWIHGTRGFVHNDVRLFSDDIHLGPNGWRAASLGVEKGKVVFWVGLLNTQTPKLRNTFTVSPHQWIKIREAVEAYNNTNF